MINWGNIAKTAENIHQCAWCEDYHLRMIEFRPCIWLFFFAITIIIKYLIQQSGKKKS